MLIFVGLIELTNAKINISFFRKEFYGIFFHTLYSIVKNKQKMY